MNPAEKKARAEEAREMGHELRKGKRPLAQTPSTVCSDCNYDLRHGRMEWTPCSRHNVQTVVLEADQLGGTQ